MLPVFRRLFARTGDFVSDVVDMRQKLLQVRAEWPLPPELAVAPPRPDVWGSRGALSNERDRERFKPLLLQGFATAGVIYKSHESSDSEGNTVDLSYAWLDEQGRLRTHDAREEFDPRHAAVSAGRTGRSIVFSVGQEVGTPLFILQDTASGKHVVYESLRVSPRRR